MNYLSVNDNGYNDPGLVTQSNSGYLEFFVCQLIHILCIYLLQGVDNVSGPLLISGAINVVLHSRLLLADVRHGHELLNPFWFYLGMSIFRLGFGTIYVGLVVWTGDTRVLALGRIDATPWLFEGHLLLLLGDYCFIAGVFMAQKIFRLTGNRRSAVAIPAALSVYGAGFIMAMSGFGIRILEFYVSLGGLGQITGYVADYGVPAGIFLMLESCRRRKTGLRSADLVLAILLLLAAVVSGFSSYMKTDLLLSLLPIIFLGIMAGFKNRAVGRARFKFRLRLVALAGLLVYFFMYTVSGYSELRRAGYWDNMRMGEVIPDSGAAPEVLPDLIQALRASLPGTEAFSETHYYPDGGAWHMLKRLSVTSWAATAITMVELRGSRQDSIIDAIILSVTPRLFFPDKPSISWGREVAVTLGQARTAEAANTATSITMYGFLYWWGGYSTLVLMSLLSGAGFMCVFLLFRQRWTYNPVATLVIMALAYDGLHWKESDVLGGIPFYIYMLVVFLPIAKLVTPRQIGNTRPAGYSYQPAHGSTEQ